MRAAYHAAYRINVIKINIVARLQQPVIIKSALVDKTEIDPTSIKPRDPNDHFIRRNNKPAIVKSPDRSSNEATSSLFEFCLVP